MLFPALTFTSGLKSTSGNTSPKIPFVIFFSLIASYFVRVEFYYCLGYFLVGYLVYLFYAVDRQTLCFSKVVFLGASQN